ncbi:hypothetical protein [Aquimarina algicola]|uniref:Uncharacterized protein n=1 Tax=Aquimarina algicola TaxID=2589995 RepID=A0A504J1G1_9FLAO|nr:hypothetical protein [Aquimarina algicola]TPN82312.1 hypothetical protein FHK87_23090 [Aquimarina algicola]
MKKLISIILYFVLIVVTNVVKAQSLSIYNIYSFEKNKNDKIGFISLTDVYPWSQSADSLVIADQHLGGSKTKNDNYHQLSPKHRKQFLHRMKIEETDRIFIYNLSSNTLLTRKVKSTTVAAHLSVYADNTEISEYDYMIGFEIPEISLKNFGDYFFNTLVYVGKQNPFITGRIKQILWKKTEKTSFLPNKAMITFNQGALYESIINGLHYYAQDITKTDQTYARHLMIYDPKKNTILFDKTYTEDESAYLNPLNIGKKTNYTHAYQWTGTLFRNKPATIFGFLGHSFGCPHIEFISKSEPSIRLKCDNRH